MIGAKTKTDWRKAAAWVRGELDRSSLSGRARLLAEFFVKCTLMQGRTKVVIQNRQRVCGLLGISKSHIGEVVQELVGAGVVQFKDVHEGWELVFFAESLAWNVDWRYSRDQLAALLAEIERAPGQAQGEFLPEPSLSAAVAEVQVERFPKKEPAPRAGEAVSPRSPLLTVHGFTAPKRLDSEPLTGQTERDLMDQVEAFVGADDVRQWGGDWRKNWVRKHPEAMGQALRILRQDLTTGWSPRVSRAAALKDLVRRLAGQPAHGGMA